MGGNEFYIWAQNTAASGQRAWPRDGEEPETNDDYVRYAGSDEEIRAQIAAIVELFRVSDAAPYESAKRIGAGTDLYLLRVARTLADAIGDDDPFKELGNKQQATQDFNDSMMADEIDHGVGGADCGW